MHKQEILRANRVFHDEYDAAVYDLKWGNIFDIAQMKEILCTLKKHTGEDLDQIDNYLDIGCGTGYYLVNLGLYKGLSHAHGMDISRAMIRKCRENAARTASPVTCAVSDAACLPYAADQFDLITARAILHHVPDPMDALQEIRRVLKPGGVCILQEPTKWGNPLCFALTNAVWWLPRKHMDILDGKQHLITEEKAFLATLDAPPDAHTFTPEDIRKMVHMLGFASTKVFGFEFLGNLFNFLTFPFRQIKMIQPVIEQAKKVLDCIDEKVLIYIVPDCLYFNLIIVVRK